MFTSSRLILSYKFVSCTRTKLTFGTLTLLDLMDFFLIPCRILVLKMCKCDKDDNDYLKQELRIEIETYLHLPE